MTNPEDAKWADIKAIMQKQLTDCKMLAASASKKAEVTFTRRLETCQSQTLRNLLLGCLHRVRRNAELEEAIWGAAVSALQATDDRLTERLRQVATLSANRSDMESLSEYGRRLLYLAATASNLSPFQDAIGLGALLIVFLGHEEAMKFEVAAVRELRDLLAGNDILDTVKRLWRVITRTVGEDQNANEMLLSLENFNSLMDAWLAIAEAIGQGTPFTEATQQPLKPWLDKG